MAESKGKGYGRKGVAVGGKGGLGLYASYRYAPQDPGKYLTGSLASEYSGAQATMKKDFPTFSGGDTAASVGVESQIAAKKKAKKSIGRLRDVAGANAVGSFLDFAQSRGRSSLARAPKGLLTGESYGPGAGTTAQTEGSLGASQEHQYRLKRGLGLNILSDMSGAERPETATALKDVATAKFLPGGAIDYRGAMGSDPRAALHQSFERLRGGSSTAKKEFGYKSSMGRWLEDYRQTLKQGGVNLPASSGQGLTDLGPKRAVTNPGEVYYGGEEGYQASRGLF